MHETKKTDTIAKNVFRKWSKLVDNAIHNSKCYCSGKATKQKVCLKTKVTIDYNDRQFGNKLTYKQFTCKSIASFMNPM